MDLGYGHLQLVPHPDVVPCFQHPKADDGIVADLRKTCDDAGVTIASMLLCCAGRHRTRTNAWHPSTSGGEAVEPVVDHALRHITDLPGDPGRVHQRPKVGDVDWDVFYTELGKTGFYDREDSVVVSSVFAENEQAEDVSRFQLESITASIEQALA